MCWNTEFRPGAGLSACRRWNICSRLNLFMVVFVNYLTVTLFGLDGILQFHQQDSSLSRLVKFYRNEAFHPILSHVFLSDSGGTGPAVHACDGGQLRIYEARGLAMGGPSSHPPILPRRIITTRPFWLITKVMRTRPGQSFQF